MYYVTTLLLKTRSLSSHALECLNKMVLLSEDRHILEIAHSHSPYYLYFNYVLG